jgi:hypothetical protein
MEKATASENEIGDDRGPKPPEQKEPNENQAPEEKDPPSRRRGPIEEPNDEPGNGVDEQPPLEAPTDSDTEKQGEVRFN